MFTLGTPTTSAASAAMTALWPTRKRSSHPHRHPRRASTTSSMHPQVVQLGPGTCPICGMALEPRFASADLAENPELTDFRRRLLWTLPVTIVVFALGMSDLLLGMPVQHALGGALLWIELVLATPVVVWAGWPLLARAAASLRTRNLNMFTLIGLGVLAAFGYSLAASLAPDLFPASHGNVAVYYEAASVIISLTLLGQIWELRARQRTGDAVRALLRLAPRTARRIDGDDEHDIPIAEVAVGDRLRVRPGEKIAVDGVVPGPAPASRWPAARHPLRRPVLHAVDEACFALAVPPGEPPAAGWPTLVFAHGTEPLLPGRCLPSANSPLRQRATRRTNAASDRQGRLRLQPQRRRVRSTISGAPRSGPGPCHRGSRSRLRRSRRR